MSIIFVNVKCSREFGIDLNAKENNGVTALHVACINGKTENVQLIIKNSEYFAIELIAKL